jgi:hypothetical protein
MAPLMYFHQKIIKCPQHNAYSAGLQGTMGRQHLKRISRSFLEYKNIINSSRNYEVNMQCQTYYNLKVLVELTKHDSSHDKKVV